MLQDFQIGDLVRVNESGKVYAIGYVLSNYTWDDQPPQTWYDLCGEHPYVCSAQIQRASLEESRVWVNNTLQRLQRLEQW